MVKTIKLTFISQLEDKNYQSPHTVRSLITLTLNNVLERSSQNVSADCNKRRALPKISLTFRRTREYQALHETSVLLNPSRIRHRATSRSSWRPSPSNLFHRWCVHEDFVFTCHRNSLRQLRCNARPSLSVLQNNGVRHPRVIGRCSSLVCQFTIQSS